MATRTEIKECVMNIDMTCRSMYLSNRDVRVLKIPTKSTVYGDMVRYSYIQLCSILDEFEILNRYAKDDFYLRDTLYVISPALKAINQYTGIRKARNNMLAHFNRDKSGKFLPWWSCLKELKLPRTQVEILQIYVWLHVINSILSTRYLSELEEMSTLYKPDVDLYFQGVEKQEVDAIKNPTPLDSIIDEVDKRMVEKNIGLLTVDPIMTELYAHLVHDASALTNSH